eukprot:3032209-Pleurochrysis_carterae.AAC.1
MKQESKEALVRDYSNRIASLLATAMRPKASLKLRKLQHTHAVLMYPSMYDGLQMFKELKHELSNLHHAYDADEHKREIERMCDGLLPDNCTGQDFADTEVNARIRDHNPYIQVPYMGERIGRLIIKFLPPALAGEGRALLRELTDKKVLGNEGRVLIEDTMRLVKLAHRPVPVSAAHKGFNKKGKKAVAAAAATRKHDSTGGTGGNTPGGRPPYELPDGQ